jgi:hypothetical protein
MSGIGLLVMVAALVVAGVVFRGRGRVLTFVGLGVATLAGGLLAGDSASANHMTLTITTSPAAAGGSPIALGTLTYADAAAALADAETAGSASLLFESGLLGMPTLDATDGFFTQDDADLRIVVRGDGVTLFGAEASVLLTAKWDDDADTSPDLAVAVKFAQVGLGTLNSAFDQFPVDVNSAIVGLGNADQTIDPAAIGAEDFFTDGVSVGGTEGTLSEFEIDDSAVTFAGAVTGGVLADGADVIGGGAIRLTGSLGVSGVLEPDGPTAGLSLSATITTNTPDALADKGVSLDGEWTLAIEAAIGESYSATFSGAMNVNVGDTPIDVGASIGVEYVPGPPSSTTFKLGASVGTVDDLAGLSWLDLTGFEVSADITTSAEGLDVSMSMTAGLSVGEDPNTVSGTVSISASRSGGATTTAFSLEVTNNISASAFLEAIGAPALDAGWDVTLTDFRLDFTSTSGTPATKSSTIAVSAGAELFAGPGCEPADPDFEGAQADVLFRQASVGTTSTFVASGQLSGLSLKQLSCDVPFDWTLPTIAVTFANAKIDQNWDTVDAPTIAYFSEIFCPGDPDACPQKLTIEQGLSVRASISLDGDVQAALEEIGISVDGPLGLTGTLPLLGGTKFELKVSLPEVSGGPNDVVARGTAFLSIATEGGDIGVSVGGDLTFRVQRPDQTKCDGSEGRFDTNGPCYDELLLTVEAGIEATTTPPGIDFSLSAKVENWNDAFGLTELDIKKFAVQMEIGVTTGGGVTVEFGMGGQLMIGQTDLTIAFQVEASPTPPRIILEGLTVGTARGILLREVVSTFAPDVPTSSIPDLRLKNLWFAYGTEANPDLCIMQGFYISAELHLNDPDPDNNAGTNPVCGTSVPPSDAEGRQCPANAGSCIAGLEIQITSDGLTFNGSISAFDIGPIAFGGVDVNIEMTKFKQQIRFEGAATLYDPVDFYLDPDGTHSVWASGFLLIDVGQAGGAFHLTLDGCALIGGSQVADSACTPSGDAVFQASVDGSVFADFTKVGMAFFEDASVDFDLRLTAPALEKLVEQIGEKLEPVADWFESAGAAVEGTTKEVVQKVADGFCVTFNVDCDSVDVAADSYDDAAEYINAEIEATDVAIRDSAAVGLHCFFTSWPVKDCVDGFRTQARDANNATIAALGGAEYIALHGIDATGFGGIVDADFPDVVWVEATTFLWPTGGPDDAPCGINGDLFGTAICDASPTEVADPDSLIAPVLLEALGEIDPVLADLFESGQLQVGAVSGASAGSVGLRAASLQFVAADDFDPDAFMDAVRFLAATLDTGTPLSVCQATSSYQWFGTTGTEPPALDLTTKIDAYGGLANIDLEPFGGAGGTAGLDLDAVLHDVLDDVLQSAVSDLQCPTTAGEPSADDVSFTMSAASIAEGSTLTLTGTAPASAAITVDWGDSTTPTAVTADTDGAWTASHVYVEGPAFRLVTATSGDLAAIGAVSVRNAAPTISGLSVPASTMEASEVSVTGTVTDPGVLDSHVVTVNWGDGTTSQQSLAAGSGGAFSLSHTYADDNPTATTADAYTVSVAVADDDGGTSTGSGPISVANVAPTDLVVDTATWGDGDSAVVDDDGHLIVPEGVAVTMSGTFHDPGTLDTYGVQVDWGDGDFTNTTTTQRDATDPTLVHFTFTHTFADDQPTGTSSDLVALRLAVSDDDLGAVDVDQPVRVADVEPVIGVGPGTQNVQYSDSIAAITLQATDVRGVVGVGGTASESVVASTRWQLDGGSWNSGLPANLVLGDAECGLVEGTTGAGTRQSCTWEITGRANVAPGTYTIELTVTDDDTLTSVDLVDVVVLPEDARVDSLAPTVASAPSVLNGFINLELRATVRDISVVPGITPADTEPGDVTHATVTFVNRSTGQALCTAPVVTMFAGDSTTGGAACTATIPTTGTAGEWHLDLGFVVGGWYTRDDAADNAPLTVRRPFSTVVHGNHYVYATSGAGTLAPTTGSRLDGALAQLRYAANRRSIIGSAVVTFQSGGRIYRATVTQVDSLGVLELVTPNTNLIEIEARANVADITSGTPVQVAAGVRLQLRYDDSRSPSTPDRMEIALWRPSGLLLSAAHWDVVEPTGMVLAAGQINLL